MSDPDPEDYGLPSDLGAPDLYKLEIPPGMYEGVDHWMSGKLVVEQTPEQREAFLDFMENLLAREGRSVSPDQGAEQ